MTRKSKNLKYYAEAEKCLASIKIKHLFYLFLFLFCPFLLSSLPLYGGGLTVHHSLFISWLVVLITVTPPLVTSYS